MGTVRMVAAAARLIGNCYRSREHVDRLRTRRLREQLRYAFDASPFYRERFRESGLAREDLEAASVDLLPTLSPRTLESEFDRIVTDPDVTLSGVRSFLATATRGERYRGEYVALRSSGTEGDPTPFLYDEREWDRSLAATMRAMVAALGLRRLGQNTLGETRTAYVAGVEGNFMGITGVEAVTDRLGGRLEAIPPNTPTDDLAERLTVFDPTGLVGYPSTLVAVADLVAEGRCRVRPGHVLSGGEPLPTDTRRYLQETFDAPVVNLYSTTETGPLGVEPPDAPGMYIFDDLAFVEPREDRTLVTPLHHRTLPLIRFELGDTLEPRSRPPDARLPFTIVESVVGRSEDLLRFDEGILFSTALNEVDAPGATRFQFARSGPSHLEVRYERRPGADPEAVGRRVRESADSLLADRGMGGVTVSVEEAELAFDPRTGKTPLVVHGDD
jgi:phenylacetate-coenzyme A ligase PaaK-like adenylate-forming protein